MSAFFMGKNKRKKEAPPKKLPLKSMSASMVRVSHMATGLLNTEVASGHSHHSRDQCSVKMLISLTAVSKTSLFQCKIQ